ncbi:TlpA disulfide reductase family protein [Bacillaceae bacterium IKA-2]|nr:TlpA disulfide reductase family protein [Bacillaceae bacterium IKA-2]
MKNIIFIVIIIGMLSWVLFDSIFSADKNGNLGEGVKESSEVGLNKGQMAPDFELMTLEGETVKLSDFKGQRVMLNFWATWCPPCRAEMPDMQKFYENKDVKILAVNLLETESHPDNVQEFIDDFQLTFAIPLDEGSAVANRYQIAAYPTSFMIDSNGRIQFKALGAMNYDFMVQEFEKMQ